MRCVSLGLVVRGVNPPLNAVITEVSIAWAKEQYMIFGKFTEISLAETFTTFEWSA